MTQATDQRHQPLRVGVLLAADVDPEPGHVAAAGEVLEPGGLLRRGTTEPGDVVFALEQHWRSILSAHARTVLLVDEDGGLAEEGLEGHGTSSGAPAV